MSNIADTWWVCADGERVMLYDGHGRRIYMTPNYAYHLAKTMLKVATSLGMSWIRHYFFKCEDLSAGDCFLTGEVKERLSE